VDSQTATPDALSQGTVGDVGPTPATPNPVAPPTPETNVHGTGRDEPRGVEVAPPPPESPSIDNASVTQNNQAPTAGPDLSGVPADDRRAMESICRTERTLHGPVPYNNCLREQLATYNAAPPAPDLSGVPADDRRAMESICRTERTLHGPVPYNNCLREQLDTYFGSP